MQANLEKRCMIIDEIRAGKTSLASAADDLGLSYRQMRRIWKRYSEEGEKGIKHRNIGRQSNRSFAESLKDSVLRLYDEKYRGLGPTEYCKILNRRGTTVDHETLRRWLMARGFWSVQHTGIADRQESNNPAGFGHCIVHLAWQGAWFGADEVPSWFHVLRDDETGIMMGSFCEDVGDLAPMRLLWAWVDHYGIPFSLSCRKPFIADERIRPTLEQEFQGEEPRTAFAQACDKLGIDMVPLNPAKGKCLIRRFEGLDAKLGLAFREAGIGSIASANAFLMSEAAAVIDPRFGGESRFSEDCHVPIVDGTDLRNVFCFRSECLISVKAHRGMGQTGGIKKVTLARWLDGSTHVLCGGKELPTAGISSGMDERVAM